MLKFRLKEKILDLLLTDISTDKQKELDEADYAIIKIKKKSAQFQHLYYSKKRMPFLFDLLDEIIFLAKEYEQFSLVVDHLKAKKNLVSFKNGSREFEKVYEELEYYSKCSSLLNKAEHYYFKLIMLYEYDSKPDKQKTLTLLEKAIVELEKENRGIKSHIINYYFKMLEMDYCNLQEDYLQARSICLEILAIVRNNKSVKRKQRIGVVYDHLSRSEFYLGHLEQSVENAHEAQKYFNPKSENFCIALEQEFYALLCHEQK